MKRLRDDHKAVLRGRTIFLQQVKAPTKVSRLLQPASNNGKLGKGKSVVVKGKWRGMTMYQLTLEERKTCPRTCQQWNSCYGNNMPFANRIKENSPAFLKELEAEVEELCTRHANGVVIRLHVLGDFYSVGYVRFWQRMLEDHSNLRVFGYTHRAKTSPIGRAIDEMNRECGSWIRWSDAGDVPMAANVAGPGIVCPEQTGKTQSCLTCGLCWSIDKPIQFLEH